MKIGLLLTNPSPHQVDFLNALERRDDIDAFVGYLTSEGINRSWGTPTPSLEWTQLPTRWTDLVTGQLKRWLELKQADIWVLSSIYTNPATQLMAHYLNQMGLPFVYMAEPPRPRYGIRKSIQKQLSANLWKRASGVITTGDEAVKRYKKVVREKIPVTSVPYYIDLSDIARDHGDEPKAIVEAKRPIKFVTSAQLIPRKGLDVLLDACQQLPESGWSLDIYGTGPLESTLKAQANRFKGEINFRGSVPYEDRYCAFKNYDVFVFPTRWDGWGMVIPEAMAHSLPVISTNQAMSAHDFIRDNENGFIGPADSPQYITGAMNKFITNQNILEGFSAKSKEAVADYTPAKGAQRLVTFLEEALIKSQSC